MKILKTETVWLYCQTHKEMTEHRIYLKKDGTEVKHCIKCRHENPLTHEIFGRQQPTLDIKKKDIQKQQSYGRQVA